MLSSPGPGPWRGLNQYGASTLSSSLKSLKVMLNISAPLEVIIILPPVISEGISTSTMNARSGLSDFRYETSSLNLIGLSTFTSTPFFNMVLLASTVMKYSPSESIPKSLRVHSSQFS